MTMALLSINEAGQRSFRRAKVAKPVLVIDHDKNDLSNIARYLHGHGYETITSSKADSGISLFFEHLPGIVFINTLMPGVNGTLIAKRLKSSHEGMRTPIFMLSPLVTGSARSEFHNWSDGIVKKPVQLGDVLFVVEKHLGPGDDDIKNESRKSPDNSKEPKDAIDDEKKPDNNHQEDSNGHRVLTKGNVEEIDMPALIGSLAREKLSGRLEIRSNDYSISVLWENGFIVGLYSANLLASLEKQEKLSRVEALAVRRKYREEGADIIASLRELKFSEDSLAELETGWRINQLRGLALLKAGVYRLLDGPVKKSILIDPFLPVHFAVKSLYDTNNLQSLIEEQSNISGRYFWAKDDPEPKGDDAQLDHLINDIHAACVKGATLGELFTLSDNPTSVLSALFALLVIGRITQNQKGAAGSKVVKKETKRTVDKPKIFDPQPDIPPLAGPASNETRNIVAQAHKPSKPKAPSARKLPGNKKANASGEPRDIDQPVANLEAEVHDGNVVKPVTEIAPKDVVIINKPVTMEEIVRRGDEFMKQNTFSRAQECYHAVAQFDHTNPEIMVKTARATYRNKFLDKYDRLIESIHFCKKAINLKPTFIPAYITLMRIFEDEHKYHLVRHTATRAFEHSPDNEEVTKKLKLMERSLARGQ
jgi:DNA-binding response OmpR family regulator/tetratricopeptide (TPR) repeat protein